MATYLALVDIGRGKLIHSHGRRRCRPGRWSTRRCAPHRAGRSRKLPEIVRFESRIFGPYPFDAVGSVVDYAPKLGYALETQTRPIYAFAPDLTTLVHETAHQWFGDSVGLKRWPDIWLNEGFATWTEWYYAERHGGRSAAPDLPAALPRPRLRHRLLGTALGPSRPGQEPLRHLDLRARRDDPGGAAAEDRDEEDAARSCGSGRPSTATATPTSVSSSPSPEKSPAATSARSSGAGSTAAASRGRPGSVVDQSTGADVYRRRGHRPGAVPSARRSCRRRRRPTPDRGRRPDRPRPLLRRHGFDPRQGAAADEDPGALAGEDAGHGGADPAATAVDHRVLALEQHRLSPRGAPSG